MKNTFHRLIRLETAKEIIDEFEDESINNFKPKCKEKKSDKQNGIPKNFGIISKDTTDV